MVERWSLIRVLILSFARGAIQDDCTDGGIQWTGDGVCDWQNNRPSCLYDGGDCCECTCVDGPCGSEGYRCLEPTETVSPSCTETVPTAPACAAGHQYQWIVRSTTEARALAQTLNCTEGSFEVQWIGAVTVEETISISNGTVLNVTGNSSAVLDGGGTNRLFTVIDAVLHLNDVSVSNGSSVFGGAIAATKSVLTFNRTTFSGNTAERSGGAIFVEGGSVSFLGETGFFNNSALYGGAAFMANDVSASWTGKTTFDHNTAGTSGGALHLANGGNASWTGNTSFWGNAADSNGGALYISSGCNIDGTGRTFFSSNTAGIFGGALCLAGFSSASWGGNSVFSGNNAVGDGGALSVLQSSSVSWTGTASFSGNTADSNGGALYASNGSSIDGTGRTYFVNNAAGVSGGASYLADRSSASWEGNSAFSGNIAVGDGGALSVVQRSSASWTGTASFSGNTAVSNGGALYASSGSNINGTGRTVFTDNTAGMSGGASYLANLSSTSWQGNSAFSGNSAVGDGGALSVVQSSSASWTGNTSFSGNAADSNGGALYASSGSNINGTGRTMFTDNTAGMSGGASYLADLSSTSWQGNSAFSGNSAVGEGGALSVVQSSSASWTGNTSFSGNAADSNGGALYVSSGSNINGTGRTMFTDNTAGMSGGASYLADLSSTSWQGNSAFSGNSAVGEGGALSVVQSSSASWTGNTSFSGNAADSNGGALYVSSESNIKGTGLTYFVNNAAGVSGGALYLADLSIASWQGNSVFSGNSAGSDGGALSILQSSSIFGIGETKFANNTAGGSGGAVRVKDRSNLRWEVNTIFSYNAALGAGGALYISSGSSLSGAGQTTFTHNNAGTRGGALSVVNGSDASWVGDTTFSVNSAVTDGGALHVYLDAVASWTGSTTFYGNTANVSGGALYVAVSSNVSCAENTVFSRNVAVESGGAQFLTNASRVSISGVAHFVGNTADSSGGALYLTDGSNTAWEGQTSFSGNVVDNHDGGAMYIVQGSRASWTSAAVFSANRAAREGGALYVDERSDVVWSGDSMFLNNTAVTGSGGAILVAGASRVQWASETNFTSNVARSDGGAIASRLLESGASSIGLSFSTAESLLVMNGRTKFDKNSCGGKGGALVILGGLYVMFGDSSLTFSGNHAAGAGGGIFISSTGEGLVLTNVSFLYNSAQSGGGVYVTGSGISTDADGEPLPTTFDGCVFEGNKAGDTGGGVESTAGSDLFVDTLFSGNIAPEGGALRLAGDTALMGCTFEGNVAEVGGGPTVSNIGTMSQMVDCYFRGNIFNCEAGTFLTEVEVDDLFGLICSGCVDCEACSFDEAQTAPACSSTIEHAISQGGHNITLEWLSILPGYWRATNTSLEILACFKANACNGGLTGSADFCETGYTGPYCSVCEDDYFGGPGFTCTECSVTNTWRIMATGSLSIFAAVFGIMTVSYLVSDETEGARPGLVDRIIRHLPLHSVKIIIVSCQIVTQFVYIAHVTFPGVYQRFLNVVHLFNFDLSWLISAGCVHEIDFHGRLLITTLCPILALGLLATTYIIALDINRESPGAVRIVRHKHLSMALLISFLVYSSASFTLIQAFDCEVLDDGNNYLRADYNIECDTFKHRSLMIYAGLMVLLYPVGIPAFYSYLLFRNRKVLADGNARESDLSAYWTSELWLPYKPRLFYYEVIECVRRIALVGVVLLVDDDLPTQITVALLLAFVFALVAGGLTPYESRLDRWISCMGHAVIVLSMFFLLLSEIDLLDESQTSQEAYGAILVAVNMTMILIVLRAGCCGVGYAKDRTSRGLQR